MVPLLAQVVQLAFHRPTEAKRPSEAGPEAGPEAADWKHLRQDWPDRSSRFPAAARRHQPESPKAARKRGAEAEEGPWRGSCGMASRRRARFRRRKGAVGILGPSRKPSSGSPL